MADFSHRWQFLASPEQYKPDFKEGDWLMVWEKNAKESRLPKEVQKISGAKSVLPGKLRYPWQGPYKMLHWVGERKCVVDKNGKATEFNVNRLFKHHSWDEKHFDTSGMVRGATPSPRLAVKKTKPSFIAIPATPPQVGEVIIFVLPVAEGHRSPFGVGRILAVVNADDLEFQWLGNYYYDHDQPFHNGWKNLRDDFGYYAQVKNSPTDVPWTGAMTGTTMDVSLVFARGNDLLTKDKRMLTVKAKKAIIQELGPVNDWPKEPEA